ncbi:MAG: calcium-binding protein [Cyanobacteria bacterium P01_G01_bin.49]
MAITPHDEEREHRISSEIIVDAYNGEEERQGWYNYLEDSLTVPFKAIWAGEIVEVLGMSEDEECLKEMKVDVCYTEQDDQDIFPMSLSLCEVIEADETTIEAISDWKYWVERGYEFSENEEEEFI